MLASTKLHLIKQKLRAHESSTKTKLPFARRILNQCTTNQIRIPAIEQPNYRSPNLTLAWLPCLRSNSCQLPDLGRRRARRRHLHHLCSVHSLINLSPVQVVLRFQKMGRHVPVPHSLERGDELPSCHKPRRVDQLPRSRSFGVGGRKFVKIMAGLTLGLGVHKGH